MNNTNEKKTMLLQGTKNIGLKNYQIEQAFKI
jgi:hypothetical protein